jgi:hypothetical protein
MPFDYLPFEFDGQASPEPTKEALAQALLDHEALWIKAAVVYDRFAAAIVEVCESHLRQQAPSLVLKALTWTEALAQRQSCALICELLCAGHWEQQQQLEIKAIQCIFKLCSPQNSSFQHALKYAFDRACAQPNLALSQLVYQAWPLQQSLIPCQPLLYLILSQSPSWGRDIGQRLALYYQEDCVTIVAYLATLKEENKKELRLALEKHLKRIFAIKKWVQCRELLK